MPNLRLKSVILILLCSAFSFVLGRGLDQSSGAGVSSYRAVYYGARCLLQHADPYDPAQFSRVYIAEDGALPSNPSHRPPFLRAVMVCVNLPTTLFLILPLALLPFGVSQMLWLAAIAISLTAAAVLAWDLTPSSDSHLPLFLICFLMANCEVLFTVANTAGIAVGLCVIAVWCFVRKRFEGLGVVALAISLALKPHDSGLIWLWLLAAGDLLRKRALQTALLVIAIALPAVLVVAQSSPHWRTELTSNLAATSARGDISDPGPASSSRKGSADIIIDLQTVLSLFNDDPYFYNTATYLVCGSLFAAWAICAKVQVRPAENAWFALAFLVCLTLVVSYHRPYDAKLLLLAMPALGLLLSKRGKLALSASILMSAAVLFTCDLPISIFALIHWDIDSSSLASNIRYVLAARQAPLALLICSLFYLWLTLSRREFTDGNCRSAA